MSGCTHGFGLSRLKVAWGRKRDTSVWSNHTQQNCGLERQVAGQETRLREPDPHTGGLRNSDPQNQINSVLHGTFFTEQQGLELHGTAEDAGRGSSDA